MLMVMGVWYETLGIKDCNGSELWDNIIKKWYIMYKEQMLKRKEQDNNRTVMKEPDEMKVMYTNRWNNTRKTRVDYLKEKNNWNWMPSSNKNYLRTTRLTLWITTIITCGGRIGMVKQTSVMIMIQSGIKVTNVEYGKGKAELISAQIMTKYGETKKNSGCILTKTYTKDKHKK